MKDDHAWLHYVLDDETTISITVNNGEIGEAYKVKKNRMTIGNHRIYPSADVASPSGSTLR